MPCIDASTEIPQSEQILHGNHASVMTMSNYALLQNPPSLEHTREMPVRVLVVEDEIDLNAVLCNTLREADFIADGATNGREARDLTARNAYDVIVLDLGLPDTYGLSLCREWRADGYAAAILMLTAQGRTTDRVTGLDSGADDYLVKPFHLVELLARIRALIRREERIERRATNLHVADLTLNLTTHVVTRGDRHLVLTHREFCILRYLMERVGLVVTRADLMDCIWGRSYDDQSNVIDVYLSRLRHHIDSEAEPPLLQTIRGIGYRIGLRS